MARLASLLDPTKTGRQAQDQEQTLPPGRWTRRSDSRDRQDLPDPLGGAVPGRQAMGNFLFLGPTGSGKTRVVEATAEDLLNDSRAVIKIDCAEFQHSHEIAKLIGSPPGYLGHRETHALLSQEALNRHHTRR